MNVIMKLKSMYQHALNLDAEIYSLCLLCLLLPLSSFGSRTGGEILLYEFAQADCATLSFPNTGSVAPGLSLTRDASLSSCVNGAVGVESLRDDTHFGPRCEYVGGKERRGGGTQQGSRKVTVVVTGAMDANRGEVKGNTKESARFYN